MEEPLFEEDEGDSDDDDECNDELVYHSELVDEKFVPAHQQMYSTISEDENNNDKTHQRSGTRDSISSFVRISEFDKRKKMLFDKLGIQL